MCQGGRRDVAGTPLSQIRVAHFLNQVLVRLTAVRRRFIHMTFTELDVHIADTGRRSLATRLVFALADCLDADIPGIDLDDFQQLSGYTRTNIRAAASMLKDAGVIDIDYYRESGTEKERVPMAESAGNRWVKQHYRLSQAVKLLLKRG